GVHRPRRSGGCPRGAPPLRSRPGGEQGLVGHAGPGSRPAPLSGRGVSRRRPRWIPRSRACLLRVSPRIPKSSRALAPDRLVAGVGAAIERIAGEIAPFPVTLGGVGGFPGPGAPRVVWVGVTEGAADLVALHARVEAALALVGIAPEGRAFHPHVTLGRARQGRSGPDL